MNCNKFNEQIIDYVDGTLNNSIMREFEEHISECSDCQRLVEEISATYKLIDIEKNISVSDNFYQATLSGLNKDKETKVISIFYNVLKPIAVAASIGLGIMIGNGELAMQSSPELEYEELSDLVSPTTPAAFSVWESIDDDNGN